MNTDDIFKAVMTEYTFAKSVRYKINGKHFHPKNCALSLILLAKPVDSIIRKRSNSTCHFCCLAGNCTLIFTVLFCQFAKSLLAVDLQLSEVSCSHAEWRRS